MCLQQNGSGCYGNSRSVRRRICAQRSSFRRYQPCPVFGTCLRAHGGTFLCACR